MNQIIYSTFAIFVFSIFSSIHLLNKIKKDWSDLNKRRDNIIFAIAIVFGLLSAAASGYTLIVKY